MHRSRPALLAATVAASLVTPALAQWRATILHPPGTFASLINAEDSGAQVGATGAPGFQHAARWQGYPGSNTDIHPPQAYTSQAWDVDQGNVVGEALIYNPGATTHAMFWPSGSNTPIDLHAGSDDNTSAAYAVCNGRQGGFYYISQVGYRACMWSGTAASRILLHPPATEYSYLNGMDAQQQVGEAYIGQNGFASLWTGTAASWVNLNPPGATGSAALDVDAGQQVGAANLGGRWHAYIWQGTAQSGVDLHPIPSYIESEAVAVHANVQVGYTKAGFAAPLHAALWRGTAQSWTDLHAFLPTGLVWSSATGVIHDGPRLRVAGWAGTSWDTKQAVIWTQIVCGNADFDGDGSAGTDADIAAFFACLAGNCCPTCWSPGADFDGDGDVGTDADIEAFFRVLAGQQC